MHFCTLCSLPLGEPKKRHGCLPYGWVCKGAHVVGVMSVKRITDRSDVYTTV